MYYLTILALKSMLSSLIGSSFYKWFQGTTMGIWFQMQVDRFMEHFAEKYDLEIAKKDSKFKADYPLVAERLETVEKNSHPCKELHEFDAYPDLIARIEELERRLKIKK